MARPLRIEIPGGIHHIYDRGNDKHILFRSDADRLFFLAALEETLKRFGWTCLGYCLMDNHYHLVVLTPEPNMSKGMHFLNGVVAQRLNIRHDQSGPVFEGRFKAKPVQTGRYVMGLTRYVARNPVDAFICKTADEYDWSSHRAVLGWAPRGFVAVDTVLAIFGTNIADGRTRYRAFVDDPRDPVWFDITKPALGDDDFMVAVLPGDKASPEVPRAQRFGPRPPLSDLLRPPVGDEAIAEAALVHHYTRVEIAAELGCHYMTICRRLKKWREAHRRDEAA